MRNYIVASWSDADQYDYSGEMLGGSRHAGRSQRVHFNPDGSACVASYADPEPKSKVSITDRILPQKRRLNKLNEEILELESAYRNGEVSLNDYTLLRDVAFSKRDRAQVLLDRASKVKPKRDETDDEYPEDSTLSYAKTFDNSSDNTQKEGEVSAFWIDDLPSTNSLKKPLKIACALVRALVRFTSASKRYIKSLSEV